MPGAPCASSVTPPRCNSVVRERSASPGASVDSQPQGPGKAEHFVIHSQRGPAPRTSSPSQSEVSKRNNRRAVSPSNSSPGTPGRRRIAAAAQPRSGSIAARPATAVLPGCAGTGRGARQELRSSSPPPASCASLESSFQDAVAPSWASRSSAVPSRKTMMGRGSDEDLRRENEELRQQVQALREEQLHQAELNLQVIARMVHQRNHLEEQLNEARSSDKVQQKDKVRPDIGGWSMSHLPSSTSTSSRGSSAGDTVTDAGPSSALKEELVATARVGAAAPETVCDHIGASIRLRHECRTMSLQGLEPEAPQWARPSTQPEVLSPPPECAGSSTPTTSAEACCSPVTSYRPPRVPPATPATGLTQTVLSPEGRGDGTGGNQPKAFSPPAVQACGPLQQPTVRTATPIPGTTSAMRIATPLATVRAASTTGRALHPVRQGSVVTGVTRSTTNAAPCVPSAPSLATSSAAHRASSPGFGLTTVGGCSASPTLKPSYSTPSLMAGPVFQPILHSRWLEPTAVRAEPTAVRAEPAATAVVASPPEQPPARTHEPVPVVKGVPLTPVLQTRRSSPTNGHGSPGGHTTADLLAAVHLAPTPARSRAGLAPVADQSLHRAWSSAAAEAPKCWLPPLPTGAPPHTHAMADSGRGESFEGATKGPPPSPQQQPVGAEGPHHQPACSLGGMATTGGMTTEDLRCACCGAPCTG